MQSVLVWIYFFVYFFFKWLRKKWYKTQQNSKIWMCRKHKCTDWTVCERAAEIDTVRAEPEWSHSCLNLLDHQSLYIYSSKLGGLSFFFFKQFGIAVVFSSMNLLHYYLLIIQANPHSHWLKIKSETCLTDPTWNICHLIDSWIKLPITTAQSPAFKRTYFALIYGPLPKGHSSR